MQSLLPDGVRVKWTKGSKKSSWQPSGHHYRVTVSYEGEATFDYWGSAHDKQRGIDPNVLDVVQAIFLDAYMPFYYEDALSLGAEFGYTVREARSVWTSLCNYRDKLLSIGFNESLIAQLSRVSDDAYDLRDSDKSVDHRSWQQRALEYLTTCAFNRPYTVVLQGTSYAIAVQEQVDFEPTYCRVVTAFGEYSEDIEYWHRPVLHADQDNCAMRRGPSLGELLKWTDELKKTVDSIGTNTEKNHKVKGYWKASEASNL